MKHNKGQCSIFLESGSPCEDCDLEGHSATCGWHKDWHKCDCGLFDNKCYQYGVCRFEHKRRPVPCEICPNNKEQIK